MPPPQRASLNDRVTTFLDALAMLAVAAGVGLGVYGARFGWPTALAGAVLGALSLGAQVLHRDRRPRQRKLKAVPPPGPSDPGNVHVMGG